MVDDLPVLGDGSASEVIYLDDNGSNPIDPIVRDAMVEALGDPPANSSSLHVNGAAAHARVEIARETIAELVDAAASDVVFTAGATEANNLILRGFPYSDRRVVVISAVEHSSVANPVRTLADIGLIELRVAPVDRHGVVDIAALELLVDPATALVSISAANSETGVINPLVRIAERAHAVGALFHTDATQFVGRLPLSMREIGIDALSLSGHKMCGPQGVGALVVDRRLRRRLNPIVTGGGQEGGLRAGSSNVVGIVGLGAAARLVANPDNAVQMRKRRDLLEERLSAAGGLPNGAGADRLPNTLNVRFPGALAEVVLARTPQVAASVGSACNAGAIEPSPTLLAMGLDRLAAQESMRLSVTRFTTEADVTAAAAALTATVADVRQLAEEVA